LAAISGGVLAVGIRRPGARMAADPMSPSGADEPVTYVGEIIDPKCWLGAMKPGSGLVHKACAELCIRGGIPPFFVGNAEGQPPGFFVVADALGKACNEAVAGRTGSLVSLTAARARVGTLGVLRNQVSSVTDLPDGR